MKICTNPASICEYKTAHLRFLCIHAEQSRSTSLYWLDEWVCHFFGDFCFILAFVVFLFGMSQTRGTRGGLNQVWATGMYRSLHWTRIMFEISNRNFCWTESARKFVWPFLPNQKSTKKKQTAYNSRPFFPNLFKVFYHWVSQKGKQEWLCSRAVVVSARIVAKRGINRHLLWKDNRTLFDRAKWFAWLCVFHFLNSLSTTHFWTWNWRHHDTGKSFDFICTIFYSFSYKKNSCKSYFLKEKLRIHGDELLFYNYYYWKWIDKL